MPGILIHTRPTKGLTQVLWIAPDNMMGPPTCLSGHLSAWLIKGSQGRELQTVPRHLACNYASASKEASFVVSFPPHCLLYMHACTPVKYMWSEQKIGIKNMLRPVASHQWKIELCGKLQPANWYSTLWTYSKYSDTGEKAQTCLPCLSTDTLNTHAESQIPVSLDYTVETFFKNPNNAGQ